MKWNNESTIKTKSEREKGWKEWKPYTHRRCKKGGYILTNTLMTPNPPRTPGPTWTFNETKHCSQKKGNLNTNSLFLFFWSSWPFPMLQLLSDFWIISAKLLYLAFKITKPGGLNLSRHWQRVGLDGQVNLGSLNFSQQCRWKSQHSFISIEKSQF